VGIMTDDEPFEKFLQDTAADYGAPRGEAPREAMWEAIRAGRASAPVSAAPTLTPRRSTRTWVWMSMAATLLLGVALGRFAWRDGTGVTVDSPASSAQPLLGPVAKAPTATAPVPVDPATVRRVPAGGASIADARSTTYTLVATRHLADVEALLSSYTSASADARADSALGKWAKQLLSNTRLLLDSPAARDPVRARLLSDLEVILVQLVQRSPGSDAEEHSSVERTINKTQIIPRLRSAAPAGLHSGTD
jgi:hypothetical protein